MPPNRPTPPRNILLLGAGELGTAFLPHLSALPNTHITVGVRNPSRYKHLASPTIALTQLDLSSPSPLLAQDLSLFDVVISATGFGQDPSTVTKLANEVVAAGNLKKQRGEGKLWFFPWQWGVDYDITGDGEGLMPLFGAQKRVRDVLRGEAEESNVQWTVVSTGIFLSFLFEPFWGVVDRSGEKEGTIIVRALRDWNHKVTVTHVDDIGRVLARIVAGDVEAENRVLYIAGDTVSYGALADIVGRVTGSEVRKEEWSIPFLEEELRKNTEDEIKKYRFVFARDGVWWDVERTVNQKLGMKMMDVETYARQLFSR